MKGQAKKDFEKWLLTDLDYVLIDDCLSLDRYHLFEHLTPSMQYGVLVDWFDSVGIYISVCHVYSSIGLKTKEQKFDIDIASEDCDSLDFTLFTDRNKAIDVAILNGMEIYNKRYESK